MRRQFRFPTDTTGGDGVWKFGWMCCRQGHHGVGGIALAGPGRQRAYGTVGVQEITTLLPNAGYLCQGLLMLVGLVVLPIAALFALEPGTLGGHHDGFDHLIEKGDGRRKEKS